jgi:hypothetical protein
MDEGCISDFSIRILKTAFADEPVLKNYIKTEELLKLVFLLLELQVEARPI